MGDIMVRDPNRMDLVQNYKIMQSDFQTMINASETKKPQNKVYLRQKGEKLSQYITVSKYLEMKTRWDAFITTNGKKPNGIWINKPVAGYWANGMEKIKVADQNPDYYKKQGITDIMVLINRNDDKKFNYYKKYLPKVIANFKGTGINIHAWMKVFKDFNDQFVPPTNENWSNKMIELVKDIATITGLKGVHLDYIRYPGTSDVEYQPVTNFCKKAREAIPDMFLSAAVFAESVTKEKYGQDYKSMSQNLDYICPMIYKGERVGYDWVVKTTKWICGQTPGKVVAGLESYKESPENRNKMIARPVEEITEDINAVLNAGAIGFIIFRDGLSNYAGGASNK